MGFDWSPDQERVINGRDKDILVSAAAGSGKTTVLVERIIRRIMDETNPIDIDELLVVTFTKAAAGEMKERIAKALDEKLHLIEDQKEAVDEKLKQRLIRQSALVLHAMITTIDSFCLFVVRNYFEELGLEPNFRIADETEVELLKLDVIEQVFEANYNRKNNEAFLELIDVYSDSKGDKKVRDMVSAIYSKSLSAPWPKKWIESLNNAYQGISKENNGNFRVLDRALMTSYAYIENAIALANNALEIAMGPQGPNGYIPAITSDIEMLKEGLLCTNYSEIYEWVSRENMFAKLNGHHKADADPSLVDKVKKIRERYKSDVNMIAAIFSVNWDDFCEQQKSLTPYVAELVRLSLEVHDAILKESQKRKMVSFSDMEHYALQILVDEETGKPRPVADEFRKHFKEIMIDEYQDSNDVQEAILKAVSYDSTGEHNMFMVGDVKQSIYSFRMAKPALFTGKYEAFSDDPNSKQERIDLSRNYRSREGVLDFCNVIFEKIMEKELGGVVYDDNAKLHYGSDYVKSEEPCAEVLLYDAKSFSTDTEFEFDKKAELEARMIAHKIKDLVGNMSVREKGDAVRPLKLSDIVILVRSIKSVGPIYQEILQKYGIPAHVDSTTGYFNATEVNLILNVLKLVDNPYQDIPMASVLKSPIVGLTEEDLAEIRVSYTDEENKTFSQAALSYLKANEIPFYSLLMDMRIRKDLSVHELIQYVFRHTGYDSYVAALPGGKTRYANLMMLVQKAIEFEATSYKGVFHFLRYISQMRKYEKDFGEADADGESGDIVHIMTIHKSKGLEFPVVFLGNAQGGFNTMDLNGDMVLHESIGIGLREIYGTPRAKRNTVLQEAIKNNMLIDSLSEELRILYVALTRAKEKIIVTGFGNTDDIESDPNISFGKKISAKNYLDWILPALYSTKNHNLVTEVDNEYLDLGDEIEEITKGLEYEAVLAQIQSAKPELVAKIKNEFQYEYPHLEDIHKKSKLSVSELKIGAMTQAYDEKEGEVERPGFAKHETEAYIPRFARNFDAAEEKAENAGLVSGGALYGTAVHRMMEVLDFVSLSKLDMDDEKALKEFAITEMKRLQENGLLEADLANRIHGDELFAFLKSSIAKPMADAASRGELYREKPFVMSLEDSEVLVQGIIDVFWRNENGEITVLDYKTDRVDSAEELVLRYKEQLVLYSDALERIYGNVKESLIYSYRLKEVISL